MPSLIDIGACCSLLKNKQPFVISIFQFKIQGFICITLINITMVFIIKVFRLEVCCIYTLLFITMLLSSPKKM